MDTLLVQIRRSAYFNVVVPTEPSQNRHGLIGSTQREGETQDPRRILMIYKEAASIHWWSVFKLEGSGLFLKRGSWRCRYTQIWRSQTTSEIMKTRTKVPIQEVEGGAGSLRPGKPLF
jgi:hypothetical protein